MSATTSMMMLLLLVLLLHVCVVSGTNNTTMFDNFTVEWTDFNILTCAMPTPVNVSLLTCMALELNSTEINDTTCIETTSANFDETTCSLVTMIITTLTSSSLISSTMAANTHVQQPTTTTATGTTNTDVTVQIRTAQANISTTTSPISNNTIQTTMGVTMVYMNASSTTTQNPYICLPGFIGPYCNISSDACAMSKPCLNAATCYPNNTLPLGYLCLCVTGFYGYDCQYDDKACRENTCWNNGTCIEVNSPIASQNGTTFKCECVTGYDGLHCELKVDLCTNITCENHGICKVEYEAWKCICLDPKYYYGDYCQFETRSLKIRQILSKSLAAVAIGAMSAVCSFVIIMDILKYAFDIDPVDYERELYRRERRRRRRRMGHRRNAYKINKLALRFQYVA